MGDWLGPFDKLLARELGRSLDHIGASQGDLPDQVVDDIVTGLSSLTEEPAGTRLLTDVCQEKLTRWQTLMVSLCARTDADGDLTADALKLTEHLIAQTWPGKKAVQRWASAVASTDDGERGCLVRCLAPHAVRGPQGSSWLDALETLADAARFDVEANEEHTMKAYLHMPIVVARIAMTPNHAIPSDKLIFSISEDYEIMWKCLIDSPVPVLTLEGALALLEGVIRNNPLTAEGTSLRDEVIGIAANLFATHDWRHAMADTAIAAANTEKSIFNRFNLLLSIAKAFKSPSAFRSALDILTSQPLLDAVHGASPEDLRFVMRAGAGFQMRTLYPTIDAPRLAKQKDLGSLQSRMQAYRQVVLGENVLHSTGKDVRSAQAMEDAGASQSKAQAFLDQDVQWAAEIANALDALGSAISVADLPVPYWWRLARCLRLTHAAPFAKLLARLRNEASQYLPLPADLVNELALVLIDSAGAPMFPEIYGYVLAFDAGGTANRMGTYSSMPSEVQARVDAACRALS